MVSREGFWELRDWKDSCMLEDCMMVSPLHFHAHGGSGSGEVIFGEGGFCLDGNLDAACCLASGVL